MIATVGIADLGLRRTLQTLREGPRVESIRGLRWLDTAAAVPLASNRPPGFRRALLIAFWDDEASAAAFNDEHPLGRRFAEDGFHAVLRPLRAHGRWPGLPGDLPSARAVNDVGPVMVTTLGRLRLSQTVRFGRASRPAERAARDADGFVWGTAGSRPAGRHAPFMVTVSMWRSAEAVADYAYGDRRAGHPMAVAGQREQDFHHESAFIRCAPISATGSITGMPDPVL